MCKNGARTMKNEKYFLRDVYQAQLHQIWVRNLDAEMQLKAIRAAKFQESLLESELIELDEKTQVLKKLIDDLKIPEENEWNDYE